MDPLVVGIIGMVALLVLMFAGLPIGFSMAVVGLAGMTYLAGFSPSVKLVANSFFSAVTVFEFIAVPMFILMGYFVFHSGIGSQLFNTAQVWLNRFPGGLAHASVAASAMFGAISGSSFAGVATMGKITVPEMLKRGYDKGLATGCVAGAGGLAMLIPPSIAAVVYATFVQTSAAKQLMAGLLPGILMGTLFMGMIAFRVIRNPALAPKVAVRYSWKEHIISLKGTWAVVLLFAVVVGGMYSGTWTATEASAAGACGAFIVALGTRRLSWSTLKASLWDTAKTTSSVFIIIAGATLLVTFLAYTALPIELARWVVGLELSPLAVIFAMMAVYLVLGMFLETMSMLLLTLPVFLPILVQMNQDLVWFGALYIVIAEAGLLTPPVGMNVYVLNSVLPDVELKDIFSGMLPFLLMVLVTLLLMIFFPSIVLWIPNAMR